jgi:phenylalanyl-tRNA synthetase beta chain
MKLSYNWLKEYINISVPTDELVNILTTTGLEVEEVTDDRKKYDGFYTARILKIEPHPDADKLQLCTVNSVNGEQTVVCGAPNVKEGQNVVLGTEGAIVPSAGFQLSKRKIRGIESNGMICSKMELELGEDHDGIWELPEGVEPSQPLADYLELDDIVFEIAITPNKGDCLSHYGIARDLAAYFGKEAKLPDTTHSANGTDVSKSVEIEIENTDACPRYAAKVVRGVKVGESPAWLKKKLTSVGLRPINNVVDATNFVLMELGQPLHAFDYDLVSGNKIIVKNATDKQKFTTLDDKERELDSEMLMICDAEKPIAVAGVMGGGNSEVSDTTVNVLIESAFFAPNSVRRTAKKLGINSDASYRFERGVDIDAVELAANRCAQLLEQIAGGSVESGIVDNYPNKKENITVSLRYARVEKIIGIKLENSKIDEILTSLNFKIVSQDDEKAEFEIPNYRHDIEAEIDLIEEVIRMYNYDNLTPQFFANVSFDSRKMPKKLEKPARRDELRHFLINRGFNESLTQNQIDPASAEIFTETPLVVSNPLGRDLSIMRPSLIPSMLRVISRNIRLGTPDLQLFEVGKVFQSNDNEENTVKGIEESEAILITITGNDAPNNWSEKSKEVSYYNIKGLLENIIEFTKLKNVKFKQEATVGFGGNSCGIYQGKTKLGHFGELDIRILKQYEVEQPVFAIELDMSKLYEIEKEPSKYNTVSAFPSTSRDLAFVLDEDIDAGKILTLIESNGGKYLKSADIFDVYTGDNLPDGKKSVAYSMEFVSTERTLTDSDIDKVINKLVNNIENTFKAQLRKS